MQKKKKKKLPTLPREPKYREGDVRWLHFISDSKFFESLGSYFSPEFIKMENKIKNNNTVRSRCCVISKFRKKKRKKMCDNYLSRCLYFPVNCCKLKNSGNLFSKSPTESSNRVEKIRTNIKTINKIRKSFLLAKFVFFERFLFFTCFFLSLLGKPPDRDKKY